MSEEKELKRSKKTCPGGGRCFLFSYGIYKKSSEYTCTKNCQLVQCKNYLFCKKVIPEWKEICDFCYENFEDEVFEFKTDEEYDCPVCYTHDNHQFMKFPACSHHFCVRCMRVIILFDEKRYHLSPVPYGCPKCPNDCQNPIKGKQCYCDEYDEIIEEWGENYPDDYERWKEDEDESIVEAGDPVYGSKKCPVCRKIF